MEGELSREQHLRNWSQCVVAQNWLRERERPQMLVGIVICDIVVDVAAVLNRAFV